MIRRNCIVLVFLLTALSVNAQVPEGNKPADAARKTVEFPSRVIRRDVPLTNSIRRALRAGTRDFTGRPGPNYWQLKTDYRIRVSLDPSTQVLSGKEEILVHNTSGNKMSRILLRLDHNIFRADVPRGFSVPAETTQGMVITRLVVGGKPVDLYARRPGRRNENAERRLRVSGLHSTLAQITLKDPVLPRGTVKLEIEWNTKLPGGPNGRGHRMTQRWERRVFQPTQWFPRIAKYDDLRGWDTSIYLGPSEFYNNFGSFDVRIDVPAGWLVSGTGLLQNAEEVLMPEVRKRLAKVSETDDELMIVGKDGRGPGKATRPGESLVWHFFAENVNDFAWATSREYVWRARKAMIPGKGTIPIHMLYLPERKSRYRNAGKLTKHALEFYSKLWAPYPFPQITLQDGPSAGMEYPMVINSNQGAADHETAHQWWPMMLGTNETRYGWMDEGFNTFMNILSRADRDGKKPNLDGLGQSYGLVSGSEDEAPMMWNANYAGTGYGYQTYRKTPLMFSMLGGIVGDDRVRSAISKYTKTWQFKHPSPWDFIFFMDNELQTDLGWFWYYWLWTTETVDGSIAKVSKTGNKTRVTVHQSGHMPSPVVLKIEFADGKERIRPMKNSKMESENSAIVRWPVDVWFGGGRDFTANLEFGRREISRITLDPGKRFPDRDPSDNVWPRKKKAPAQ